MKDKKKLVSKSPTPMETRPDSLIFNIFNHFHHASYGGKNLNELFNLFSFENPTFYRLALRVAMKTM